MTIVENKPTDWVADAKKLFDISDMPEVSFTNHKWRQEGTRVSCQSCATPHAFILDSPDTQLYGIDEKGLPLFKQVTVKD